MNDPRSSRRLLFLCTLVIVAMLLPASSAFGANWVWSGDGPGTVTVSDGTTSDPAIHYEVDHPGYNLLQWWRLYTTATFANQVTLRWQYSGLHGWSSVRVKLLAFVTRDDVTQEVSIIDDYAALCCNPPSNGFSYEGAYTFDLQPGDVYGFKFGGSNGDETNFLNGDLVIHPVIWSGDGPGTMTVSDGTTSAPVLHYEVDHPGYNLLQWWRLYTTATFANQVTLRWQYSGLHGWSSVRVKLLAFVTRDDVTQEVSIIDDYAALCCNPPSNGFSYEGAYTFDLQPGDVYGFKFGGSNGDETNFLNGTLVVNPMRVYLPLSLRGP